MRVRLPQRFNTLRTLDCTESGFREVRGYPCCSKNIGKRAKHYRKTLPAMMKANQKRSLRTCTLEALNNFDKDDVCITFSFAPDTSDEERYRLFINAIRHLRKKYKYLSLILIYLLFWGRGKENNELHAHLIVKRNIDFNELRKLLCLKGKIDIHIQRMSEGWSPSATDKEVIEAVIRYLYPHSETLTDKDKKLTKMNKAHWIPSRTLNKVEVTEQYDDDETEQPVEKSPYKQLNLYLKAWQRSPEDFNALVEKYNPDHCVIDYGYFDINRKMKSPFFVDIYGKVFFKVRLARVGSKIYSGSQKTVIKKYKSGNIEHWYVVDTFTGEVIRELEVDLITGTMRQVA